MRTTDIDFDADIKHSNVVCAYAGKDNNSDIHFDIARGILERHGYQVISAEELAGLRIKEGLVAPICGWGSKVREGAIYLPNGEVHITKNSPLLEFPEDFQIGTGKHTLSDEHVARALENSVQLNLTNLKTGYGERVRILTKEFSKEPIITFLFGENTQEYIKLIEKHHESEKCSFVKEAYIDFDLDTKRNSSKTPFAKQIDICAIRGGSYSPIWCGFGDSGQVRGIRYDGKTGLDPIGILVQRELESFRLMKEGQDVRE